MINKDLLGLKIDTQTNNNIADHEMAVLLDKPEFFLILPRLRKEYLIDKFISLDKFMDYFS